jgi:glycosyltransferase involved in cell wall biosynthesis
MMRILHTVEFYNPSTGGAQEVVRQISEQLVQRGHHVTVATTKLASRTATNLNGVEIQEFDVSGNTVRGMLGEIKRYQQFLLESHFDVMMNYAAQQWATDLAFPMLDRLKGAKVMIPCGFSCLNAPPYAAYFSQMPEVMRHYDCLVFHASHYRDIDFARENGLVNLFVIPNGAGREEFEANGPDFRRIYKISEDTPLLLTVGSHTGQKGHRLVLEVIRSTRLDRAVLVIIGNALGSRNCLLDCRKRAFLVNWTGLGRKRVLLLDLPRPEVVAAFKAADLFVFGSNIEYSPLVLFEAMAARTAFVTVACGNAEEIVTWGNGGVIIPTIKMPDGRVEAKPSVMARTIEDMIYNPTERNRIAEAGHKAWLERFTWEKIALQYEELYLRLLENRHATE